jgi:hypothetical protein
MYSNKKRFNPFHRFTPLHTAYRLDFREPDLILKNGFNGSNGEWPNRIFGDNTVFASKTLRGVSRFFLESVLNERVDGSKQIGSLQNFRDLYPSSKKCYVYKINTIGLEYVDLSKDLANLRTDPNSSTLFKFLKSGLDKSYREVNPKPIEFYYEKLIISIMNYSKLVAHTEELIIEGPIQRERLSLYQTL